MERVRKRASMGSERAESLFRLSETVGGQPGAIEGARGALAAGGGGALHLPAAALGAPAAHAGEQDPRGGACAVPA